MMLEGKTFRMPTPVGTAYITINENGHGAGQPFEVFINTSKAGSEIAAISEAIGRLISVILRQTSPVSQRDRVREVVDQLGGIGGGRQTGFGPNRVASLPDGISQTLQAYLQATSETVSVARPNAELSSGQTNGSATSAPDEPHAATIGDICPDCGSATLIRKEGCISCHECGYSEC
jgi:ribonucleoside-diphosphate reductase alpha chain